jgi:hypothetical protein
MSKNAGTVKKTTDTTQLQPIEDYAHDNLELIFYVFCEFVLKYGEHMIYLC